MIKSPHSNKTHSKQFGYLKVKTWIYFKYANMGGEVLQFKTDTNFLFWEGKIVVNDPIEVFKLRNYFDILGTFYIYINPFNFAFPKEMVQIGKVFYVE